MIAAIRSDVPTGRSMKIRDGFMSRDSGLLAGLGWPARCATRCATRCGTRCATRSGARCATLAIGLATAHWGGLRAALRGIAGLLRCRCATLPGLPVGRRGGHRTRRRARAGARPADLGAVAQTVGAVDHDLVADLQAAGDLLLLAVGG